MVINPSIDNCLQPDTLLGGLQDGKIEDVNKNLVLNRLETPITLDPDTVTFEEIRRNAEVVQFLSPGTVEKRLRYLRFMENYALCPVDLRRPSRENFLRHIRTRLYAESPPATPDAIRHEWKAMRMLLQAYGLPCWDIRLPPSVKSKKRVIPLPEVVREFWHYRYTGSKLYDKELQYMFFVAFNLGVRNPSELSILRTSDFLFNRDGTAIATITETKKHAQQRSIVLPYVLASDPKHKSIRNWIDSWRPKIESQYSDDYLFVQPRTGKPYGTRYLGKLLSEYGKMVWQPFQPYVTRHWSAIARLIEQKEETGQFDCYPVMNWLGHENIQTTMLYVKYAEQYYSIARYSWLSRVLKCPKAGDSTLSSTNRQKTLVSDGNSPRERYGPGETCTGSQKGLCLTSDPKSGVLDFQPISFFFSLESPCFHCQWELGGNGLVTGNSAILVMSIAPQIHWPGGFGYGG